MDPDSVKTTLSNLAFGNVMAAAARDYQKKHDMRLSFERHDVDLILILLAAWMIYNAYVHGFDRKNLFLEEQDLNASFPQLLRNLKILMCLFFPWKLNGVTLYLRWAWNGVCYLLEPPFNIMSHK
ncbi:hypothetical protein CK203_066875 [Vitis vinifera]|uniref:Uncharacterized protein n=1 Tax=Vitis vinifera TaxID=29760 RepID=A0A438EUY5_VITVI|nr:hypothetical protein CK203_066875 [Vitis vinifera]